MVIESAKPVGLTAYTGVRPAGPTTSSSLAPADAAQRVQRSRPHRGRQRDLALLRPPTTLPLGGGRPARPGRRHPAGRLLPAVLPVPADQEQQTLALVQRTLVGAGLALVVLLAAIASLVTRWVVIPVRLAARRRPSGWRPGELDERMRVRGEDDLAALATSFNDMAASLQDKMRELEELSQVQRQFVSDVSHELRTPLTTIRMAADVLLRGPGRPSTRPPPASAELLQSQLDRFESLLADLLEISRYDAGAATLEPESVDICDIVRRAADDAQQLAERRGAGSSSGCPPSPAWPRWTAAGSSGSCATCWSTRSSTARAGTSIVTVAADRDAVAVAVRDHGVGLEPGEEQLVFDRFWRADPARARTTGGTGLGLSIALEDARLHGGWLQAWGEPGRGSVFRLTLPRVAGRGAGRLAAAAGAPTRPSHAPRWRESAGRTCSCRASRPVAPARPGRSRGQRR